MMAPGDDSRVQGTAVFWDVVGSMGLYRTLGNKVAERLIRTLLRRMEACALPLGGRVVKSVGDGLMLHFSAPDQAARACIAAQEAAVQPLNGDSVILSLRMGFAHGEILDRPEDIYGDCVNLAAWLCKLARPGFILTNRETHALLDPELGEIAQAYDVVTLKGLNEPITLFQIPWSQKPSTEIVPVASPQLAGQARLSLRYRGNETPVCVDQLPITIGRAKTCTLSVDAAHASRQHLQIENRRGKFVLVDQSTNGTYVRLLGAHEPRLLFLRNEEFILVGAGALGLGTDPDGDPARVEFVTD